MAYAASRLNLLIIEDNLPDYLIIKELLEEGHAKYKLTHAKSRAAARTILSESVDFDAILLDLTLPDGQGEPLVLETVKLAPKKPLIVLTGYADQKFGVEALKLGATDYLLKDGLTSFLLIKSITYAIERKKNLLDLKNSEKKYKELFYANPQPLWVYDFETLKFLHVNEAAVRHYGYTREEFLNMTIKDIRPEEDIEDLMEMVASSKILHKYVSGGFRHRKKNGEIIRVEIQSNSILFEDRMARLILADDVTEKLKNQESLRLSEQRFKALVQEGSDMIAIADLEGNYKYVSPTIEAIMGQDAADFIGKSAFDYVHDKDKGKVKESYARIATERRIHIPPFRFETQKGNWRWIESVVTNMLDDPSVEGIVTNSRDVTERMNYLEAIKEQNMKLRQIAWTQSHVVRAPLARILGIVDLIKNDVVDQEVSLKLLDCLFRSAADLDEVIKEIVQKAEQVRKDT